MMQKQANEEMASKLGFSKVSMLKLAVVKKLKEYVNGGGFMFTMCSGTTTPDIALASQYTDICDAMYDGDPADPNANDKLDYSECMVFQNFHILLNPYVYEYSDIDITDKELMMGMYNDYFTLFDFSAKIDPVPTMLTQCHTAAVKGFLGQESGFIEDFIKPGITILAKNDGTNWVKYVHGNLSRVRLHYGSRTPKIHSMLLATRKQTYRYIRTHPVTG
jgi:hypothetical protein